LDVKTLKQLGISKKQSSRWQQLADVPEDQFEAALPAPDKPSTSGIIARAEIRMADEIDAAQARGEVAGHGGARNFKVENPDLETPGLGKIGVTKQNLYDWRKLREAGGAARRPFHCPLIFFNVFNLLRVFCRLLMIRRRRRGHGARAKRLGEIAAQGRVLSIVL
jgi:hypothetical protein